MINQKILFFLCWLSIITVPVFTYSNISQPKILHLTFHMGCAKEITEIAKIFNLDLTTWFIPSFPPKFWDDFSHGNAIYNIGHDRAARIWKKHHTFFEQFDAIITSDTAPLARIFLQNSYTKPLIIWVCNRFDYCDRASLDCNYPDKEYYQIFRNALYKKNVKIVSYTPFEYIYALTKGVNLGTTVIKPTGLTAQLNQGIKFKTNIPTALDKPTNFFIPSYNNDHQFAMQNQCESLGIKAYCGRYNGALDLSDFKGIIHMPYAWSNLALWENIQLGLIYFIPSLNFAKNLSRENYYFQNINFFLGGMWGHSEWYNPENASLFVYFDSWKDLKQKVTSTNFKAKRNDVLNFARQHKNTMIEKWRQIFASLKLLS